MQHLKCRVFVVVSCEEESVVDQPEQKAVIKILKYEAGTQHFSKTEQHRIITLYWQLK